MDRIKIRVFLLALGVVLVIGGSVWLNGRDWKSLKATASAPAATRQSQADSGDSDDSFPGVANIDVGDPKAPGSALAVSTKRLSSAFAAFPRRRPIDLVAQANKMEPAGSQPCPLIWNENNQPAIVLRDRGPSSKSISAVSTLNDCAAAIERLPKP